MAVLDTVLLCYSGTRK